MAHHLSSFETKTSQESCSLALWINHSKELRTELIAGLWEADRLAIPHDRILSSIVVTHMDHFHPAFTQASHSEVEGHFETPESYVEWALAFAIKHGINTLLPNRFSEALIANKQAFEAIGVTVLHACEEQELAVTENRPALYRCLAEHGEGAWVPAFGTWKDDYSVKLSEVVDPLKSTGESLCVMPATGKIGDKLFRFVDEVAPWHALEHPNERVTTVGVFGGMAHSYALRVKMNKEWVVMKYLPNVTISVDCLAWSGELLTHVSRVQDAHRLPGHLVLDNLALKRIVQTIARLFKMNGVFRVKFLKDSDGSLKVLCVTTGLPYDIQLNALAGVDLPWLWLKLHADQGPRDYQRIPAAVAGRRLGQEIHSVKMYEAPVKTRTEMNGSNV